MRINLLIQKQEEKGLIMSKDLTRHLESLELVGSGLAFEDVV